MQSYKINENIREQFKVMLLNKLRPLIGDLQDYYNSNIVVSNVLLGEQVQKNLKLRIICYTQSLP